MAAATYDVNVVAKVATLLAQKANTSTSYHLKVKVEVRTPKAHAPNETMWSSTLHIWRNEDKFRVDHLDAHFVPPRSEYEANSRHVICMNCEKQGYGLVTTVRPGRPLARHIVDFRKLNGLSDIDYHCNDFDWRFFGLSNTTKCLYKSSRVADLFLSHFKIVDLHTQRNARQVVSCRYAQVKSLRKIGMAQ